MVLNVQIITPYRKAWSDKTDQVVLPTSEGEAAILSDHTNLVAVLTTGIVTIEREDKKLLPIIVLGGIAAVVNNNVVILVNDVEDKPELSLTENEMELQKALDKLKNEPVEEQAALTREIQQISTRIKFLKLLAK